MRAGRGFGMILHAEDRQFSVTHAFHRVVVQIDMAHFNIFGLRPWIDRESMILRSDCDFARM